MIFRRIRQGRGAQNEEVEFVCRPLRVAAWWTCVSPMCRHMLCLSPGPTFQNRDEIL